MHMRDWTEIAAWTGISTVIGLAAFGGRTAVSGGSRPSPPQPAATIGACRVTARAAALPGSGAAAVKLSIANPGTKPETVTFDVDIVSRKFTGSALSRVPSGADFRVTTVSHRQISRTIAPGTISPVSYMALSPAFGQVDATAQAALTASGLHGGGSRATLAPANYLSPLMAGQSIRTQPAAGLATVYEVVVQAGGRQTLLTSFVMQGA